MEPHVPTQLAVSIVSASTVGPDLIVARMWMTALEQPVSTVQLVTTELAHFTASVHRERPAYFVIWTMPVLAIHVMLVRFATQVPLMVPTCVHVQTVIKESIALKILMNVKKVPLANMTASA